MTTPNETPNPYEDHDHDEHTPDQDAMPAPTSGHELVELPPAGEVVNLADARRARGLDQDTGTGHADDIETARDAGEAPAAGGEVLTVR